MAAYLKTITIFLLALTFRALPTAKAQQDSDEQYLHLVMAYADHEDRLYDHRLPDIENKEFLKLLLRVEGDTLAIVDTLNAKGGLKMDFLSHCPQERLLYFSESDLFGYDYGSYLSIFDYRDGFTMRRLEYERKPNHLLSFSSPHLLYLRDTFVFSTIKDLGEDHMRGVYIDVGFDRYFNERTIQPADFRSFVVPGAPGMQRTRHSMFPLIYVWENYDSLKIFKINEKSVMVNKELSKIPNAPFQVPDSLRGEENNIFYAVMNNDEYCVGLLFSKIVPNITPINFSALLLNKSTGKWSKLTHLDGGLRIMNWGDWLYGTVVSERYYDRDSSSFTQRQLDRYDEEFGRPKYYGHYYPGVLFLYHIPSEKYIEWKTNDPDSEILTVIDGDIYYRIFDELRKVHLNTDKNHIDWSTDRLIFKDIRIIPNVHWVFFAPKTAVQEVWANPIIPSKD